MWHYFWAHTVYHCARCWAFRDVDAWLILSSVLVIVSFCTILPHIWVLCVYDYYVLYCSGPMYHMTAASLVLTVFMITFCVVFVLVNHIPTSVKTLFHLFGLLDFVFGLVFVSDSVSFHFCASMTPVMYGIFDVFTAATVIPTAYFAVVLPLWVCNLFTTSTDMRSREGRCARIARTCPCVCRV